ncbi:MAG TPA: serine hydrolase domain-containing protein [Roseiflexaceae bacterium]|nr:serine hydrolase domain-containing protein [Roseiflexaceae bacterium]
MTADIPGAAYGLPPAAREAAAELVRAGQVPGLIVAARRAGAEDSFAIGVDAQGRALTPDTFFPVASVTKLATALTVLRLIDQGALGLDDELAAHLPAAAASQGGVTLRALLCHTAGLPLDVPQRAAPYAEGLDWPQLGRACMETPLEAAPWTRVQYSNVGYGLLALAAEHATGQGFAAALRSLVLGPLGVEGYLGAEPPRPPAALADVRGAQRGTPLEPFNSRFWRSLALPWAGLVTTAAGVLALLSAFLGAPAGFLTPPLRAAAIADQTGGLGGGFIPPLAWSPCPWGLGPEVRGHKTPHWVPPEAGPASFGHSGASGSLAWADPASGLAWVILGARTADNGWLLRRSGSISATILAARSS